MRDVLISEWQSHLTVINFRAIVSRMLLKTTFASVSNHSHGEDRVVLVGYVNLSLRLSSPV